jgi:hypothetical protein
MDETRINIYDPEMKEHSKEWRHSGSPCPKKFKTNKSSSKVLASVFWDKDRILPVGYLEKGATITVKYCIALLDKLKQQLVSIRRGKLPLTATTEIRKSPLSQMGKKIWTSVDAYQMSHLTRD